MVKKNLNNNTEFQFIYIIFIIFIIFIICQLPTVHCQQLQALQL